MLWTQTNMRVTAAAMHVTQRYHRTENTRDDSDIVEHWDETETGGKKESHAFLTSQSRTNFTWCPIFLPFPWQPCLQWNPVWPACKQTFSTFADSVLNASVSGAHFYSNSWLEDNPTSISSGWKDMISDYYATCPDFCSFPVHPHFYRISFLFNIFHFQATEKNAQ